MYLVSDDGRRAIVSAIDNLQGTATLEDFDPAAELRGARNVKRDKDGIILVPQPSDDPKDPLVGRAANSQQLFRALTKHKNAELASLAS